MVKKGNLIVIEGGDGSGKSTQAALLIKLLEREKIPAVQISFPRYDSRWGKIIKKYLIGEFGNPVEIDPYFAAMLYANDRMAFKAELKKLLSDGKTVICDRYVPSNIGHQAAKFKVQSAQLKFIKWLEDFEYGYMGVPKEDVVVYLSVPAIVSQKLMDGRQKDLHEKDVAYAKKVWGVYEQLSKSRKNWVRVECTKQGKMLAPNTINETVNGLVAQVLRKRK